MKIQEILQEQMFCLIDRLQMSGLSRKTFFELENIGYKRLGYRHKKY